MAIASLVQLIRERSERTPDSRAYAFLVGGKETESLTFAQLDQRVRAVGARLQQLRARGERVLLLYTPGTEFITAFYGCLAAGALAVPAYPPRMNRSLQRLKAIVADAQPKFLLTTQTISRQMHRQPQEASTLTGLECLMSDLVPSTEADNWIDPRITGNTVAFLQYTSGSTSKPKGVIVSHENILHNQRLMEEAGKYDAESVILSWLPLFHDMGLISVVLASLYNGIPSFLISPVEFLARPLAWLEAISRYRGTHSGAPDFGFQYCVDKISERERKGLDLSSWRIAFNGSEPVRAITLHNFTKAFAGCGFRPEAMYPCYGLAEHTLFTTGGFYRGTRTFSRASLEQHHPCASGDGPRVYLVSCGATLLDTELKIVDPVTCRLRSSDEVGEIWLASPSVAQGYWNQAEISKEVFHARLENGDGPYLRTGDLGFINKGELFITGRLKDLIIIRGRNLVPQDIEQTVEQCSPAIRTGFVSAVSVDVVGVERLVIVAEVRRDFRRGKGSKSLIDRIRSAVASEYSVDSYAVVLLRAGGLPKTSSGKTQRAKVRQDFLAGNLAVLVDEDRVPALWRDESHTEEAIRLLKRVTGWGLERVETWLVEQLASRLKQTPERIDRDRSVFSYGLDSVAAMVLVSSVEEAFGDQCDGDTLFDGEPTVRQLAHRIWRASQASQRSTLNQTSIVTVAKAGDRLEAGSGLAESLPTKAVSETDRTLPTSRAQRPLLAPAPTFSTTKSTPPPYEHPFRTSVNPELGRALAQMGMDKIFVKGEGSWLWDREGRRYLDFLAQYGALPFGFNPPRIWQAINAVRDSGEPSFVQPSYLDAAGELAQRLLAVAPPGMRYVTFANSGAEAVEAAIKLCRSATGRLDILSTSGGFHGKTLGALSATPKEEYQKPFGAPVQGFDYVSYGDVKDLRQALSRGCYAAFLVEPIQAEGGIVEPPAGYLRFARKACREAGTLFVADEVQTGLGRTGTMFACCDLGITPDVMTVGKALSGGLIPIGACLSTAGAYNEEFALKHTSTFAGNALACRTGIAALDLLEENSQALIKQVSENGARLRENLRGLKQRFPGLIAEVRGRGYLLGLRFGLDRNSVEDGLLGFLGEQERFTALIVSHLLHVEGLRLGYTLNQGGVLRIEPPLTATWEECLFALRALERLMMRLWRRDLGALTSQVTGRIVPEEVVELPSIASALTPRQPERRSLGPDHDDGRFAFLVHPLAWKDYADFDTTLSALSESQLAKLSAAFADNFDPFVISETRVVGRNGKAAYGEFILIPRLAEELKSLPYEKIVPELLRAVRLGHERGAKIVGLGAYTSVVTRGGLSLKGPGIPPLTTGNSYTAIAAYQTVHLAAAERGWKLPRRTAAIVGAGGAIGRLLSVLLARDVGRLVLLGNPAHPEESRQRLLHVAGQIVLCTEKLRRSSRHIPGSIASWVEELGIEVPAKIDRIALTRLGEELIRRTSSVLVSVDTADMLPEADVVVCCSSSTEPLVRENYLRSSAVVCDVSRPSNVGLDVLARRPDVMVIDGGVVRLPGDALLGLRCSLPKGHAYACIAETMMLAMEHRYEDMSLGFDLHLEQVLAMEQLGADLGFQVVLDLRKAAAA